MFKVGDKVIANGYPGIIKKVHTDIRRGMIDVRLKSGDITICTRGLVKV